MKSLYALIYYDMKRRSKDGFMLGYNIIFPIIMIMLLGYLLAGSYGKTFTSYHYYTLVMLPFCIAMAMITASYAGKDEAYKKTAVRLLFAPISSVQIVLSKLFSCTIIISLCTVLVLLFAELVLKLPLAGRLFPVILLLSAETFCICAIGLFIGLGMKNFLLIKNLLNLPICIAGILGGAFFPFGTLNQKLGILIKLSPLTWINRSMFLYLYDGSSILLWRTIVELMLIGFIFTLLAVKLFKKEEFIHGSLPGYQK